MLRRLAPIVALVALGGCWQVHAPPDIEETDAYRWRAALSTDAADAQYRFGISRELRQWMKEHDVQGPAVFDADGRPMACSELRGSNAGPGSIAHVVQGRVSAFEPTRCPDSRLRICFKDAECVADFCPHVTVDMRAGSIGDLHTPEQLLAVANAELPPPPFCTPAALGAQRPCTAADEAALEQWRTADRRHSEARSALQSADLGKELPPDAQIEEERRARLEHRSPKPVVRLPVPPIMGMGVPKPPPLPFELKPREMKPLSIDEGFVVEFDDAPSELRLIWNRPVQKSTATVTIASYDAYGRPFLHRGNLDPKPGSSGDAFEQAVGSDRSVRAYRVAVEPEVSGLQLIGATSTTREPKPFMRDGQDHYGFLASGRAPYFVYLGRGGERCGTSYDSRRSAASPHADDPEWPLVARVASPEANPRSAWAAFKADHPDVLPWVEWATVIGAAWILALLATIARWLWVGYGPEARRRR